MNKLSYNYDISLMIDNIDFSYGLSQIVIINERPLQYPIIHLTYHGDTTDILLLKEISPDKDINLNIKLLSYDQNENQVVESYDLELIEIKRDILLNDNDTQDNKIDDNNQIPKRSKLMLQCVFKKHLSILKNKINKCFINNDLNEIMNYIQEKTNVKLNLKTSFDNKNNIYQYFLRDSSIIESMNILDKRYSFYDDSLFYRFEFNSDELIMTKLNDLLNVMNIIKVNHLQTTNINEEIKNKIYSYEEYMTQTQPNYGFENNTILQQTSNKYKYVAKSLYNIYDIKNKELRKYYEKQKSSLNFSDNNEFKQNDILFEKEIKDSVYLNSYLNDENINDNSIDNFHKNQISNMLFTNINIQGKIKLTDFQIGNIIDLKTDNIYYQKIMRYFMIDKSSILLKRNLDKWEVNCDLNLVRTNDFI